MLSYIRGARGDDPAEVPPRRDPHGRAAIFGAVAALAGAALVLQVGAWAGQPSAAVPATEPLRQAATTFVEPECTREIAYQGLTFEWSFEPCVPEGAELPGGVLAAMERDYQTYLRCRSQTPDPTASAVPTPTTPVPTASPTGNPTSAPTTPPPPSGPPASGGPGAAIASEPPEPCPEEVTPSESPSPPVSEPPSPSPSESEAPACPVESGASAGRLGLTGTYDPDEAKKLEQARKDRECPNNSDKPVVLVALGDSVTSAHYQHTHHYKLNECAKTTNADRRKMPGNDMEMSYAGRYAKNLNKNVVEYYNFARTGFSTVKMVSAGSGTLDTCGNKWDRDFTPLELADRAVRAAKSQNKAAYVVADGGVNNTNWTDVLSALATCQVVERVRDLLLDHAQAKKLRPTVKYYDTEKRAKEIARGDAIRGGGCDGFFGTLGGLQRWIHKWIAIPVYDGPSKYREIRNDVRTIASWMVTAKADKVIWMAYYDITAAQVDAGKFAQTYRDRMPARVQGFLPNFASFKLDLVGDRNWKAVAGQWTTDLNAEIKKALPDNAKVRFQDPPALRAADMQDTIVGGCPHPNADGHNKLANSLDTGFKAI